MVDYSIRNRTVIAATANEGQVTLYFVDGETMVLPSNQEFTRRVVDAVTPALAKGQTITLNMEHKTLDIFTKYEEKSRGFVKFFRVMKNALTGQKVTPELLESIALPLGSVDLADEDETVVAVVTPNEVNEADEVSQEDLEAAAEFYDRKVLQNGMVDLRDKPAPQPGILVGAEKLATQVKHFTDADDEGFKNFLTRMTEVAKIREHSAQELMDFLKKNDLPIASDGCIVAYKRLTVHARDLGIFVDTHSRKVTQRVGTRVFMKAEMVDPDRRNECSNGLHVGRRDYMSSFGGDTIVLVKIRPEDVIAVPKDYSGSKMRCCAYTIVAEVSGEALQRLSQSQDMTEVPTAAQMLTRVLKGDHAFTTEMVEITKNYGGGLIFTDLWNPSIKRESLTEIVLSERGFSATKPVEEAPVEPTKALKEVTAAETKIDPKLNSPEVIKKKAKEAAPASPSAIEMTEQQKLAKEKWSLVKSGELSKSQLARDCGTSPRSLDRWAEKFNF